MTELNIDVMLTQLAAARVMLESAKAMIDVTVAQVESAVGDVSVRGPNGEGESVDPAVCPHPITERAKHPDSVMGNGKWLCKLCGDTWPMKPDDEALLTTDEGGDDG